MNAAEFFEHWTTFIDTNLRNGVGDIKELWASDKQWTNSTIGHTLSAGDGSPFGNFMMDQLGGDWCYWNENRNVDLALARKDRIRFTSFQDREYDPMKDRFYPAVYDVLIEHEAHGSISWQEMVKLIHMRGKLKVVITYTWDKEDKRSQKLMHHMTKAFGNMIAQANAVWSENNETGYLLIFGQKDSELVNWIGTEYDAAGAIIDERLKRSIAL